MKQRQLKRVKDGFLDDKQAIDVIFMNLDKDEYDTLVYVRLLKKRLEKFENDITELIKGE